MGLDTKATAAATIAGRVARRQRDTTIVKRAAAVARRRRRTALPPAAVHHRHLSRRQAEVADLAAGGLTDREIAARRFVRSTPSKATWRAPTALWASPRGRRWRVR